MRVLEAVVRVGELPLLGLLSIVSLDLFFRVVFL